MMVRIQIQLTEAQANGLRELAAKRRKSIAELTRQGVDHILQTAQEENDMSEKRRQARLVSGQFSSGLPDLGINHDYYFAEGAAQWCEHRSS